MCALCATGVIDPRDLIYNALLFTLYLCVGRALYNVFPWVYYVLTLLGRVMYNIFPWV
jgi:hypothetical protein